MRACPLGAMQEVVVEEGEAGETEDHRLVLHPAFFYPSQHYRRIRVVAM